MKNNMTQKDKKSSESSAGWIAIAAIIGAGIGFLFSKLTEKQSKEQQAPHIIAKKQKQPCFVKTNIDNYDDLQQLMTCPITNQIMNQPCVLTACGHSFEKQKIQDWIKGHSNCPLCKVSVSQQNIKTNFQLKQIIHHYQRNRNKTKNEKQTQQK